MTLWHSMWRHSRHIRVPKATFTPGFTHNDESGRFQVLPNVNDECCGQLTMSSDDVDSVFFKCHLIKADSFLWPVGYPKLPISHFPIEQRTESSWCLEGRLGGLTSYSERAKYILKMPYYNCCVSGCTNNFRNVGKLPRCHIRHIVYFLSLQTSD
jgi:hypothetical protein